MYKIYAAGAIKSRAKYRFRYQITYRGVDMPIYENRPNHSRN